MDFEPEDLAVIKARVPQALAQRFDILAVLEGKCLRPGQQRQNVFDFPDGMRMILSIDCLSAQSTMLHASFSRFAKPARDGEAVLRALVAELLGRRVGFLFSVDTNVCTQLFFRWEDEDKD